MIYGIIVSIIDGKQVASVCSFKFEDLDAFNHYNENSFKPVVEMTKSVSSLMVCTSFQNLADFCGKTGIEFEPDRLITYNP